MLNALWGRFDQTMGNLGTLYSVGSFLDDFVRVYLLSEDSLVCLLKPVSLTSLHFGKMYRYIIILWIVLVILFF